MGNKLRAERLETDAPIAEETRESLAGSWHIVQEWEYLTGSWRGRPRKQGRRIDATLVLVGREAVTTSRFRGDDLHLAASSISRPR